MRTCAFFLGTLYVCLVAISVCDASEKPNILVVTVDDMSCDSVGVFGCRLHGTTPNIDRFAAQGLRYEFAHVQTGSCNPSRNVMFSGRYSHNTGVEGFYEVPEADYPHLVDLMKAGGYFVGIRHKVSHSTPYAPYAWDKDLSVVDGKTLDVKNAQTYFDSTKQGIELAKQAGKPFCLNINISDPHKPFYAMGKKGDVVEDNNVPTLVYSENDVPIPGFLFDDPDVRKELAHYYSSVRRADDCFGKIMEALEQSGQRDSTVVMFLSDHGMPLPFAKTAIWHHSTHTPWIIAWPGVTAPGTIDSKHMISAVDMLPTLLDIAGLEHPDGFDGRSFLPTLRGQNQPGRDFIYKFHDENSGRNRSPMRGVESKRFGYNFNPWSDGQRVFRTATTGTLSYRAMKRMSESDPTIAARLDLFEHGTPEEFYDYESDPDALNNLIDDPTFANQIEFCRNKMRDFMVKSNDPLLEAFDRRNDKAFLSQVVDQLQAESDARSKAKRLSKPKSRQGKRNANLFRIKHPNSVNPGGDFCVAIEHKLPEDLGQQSIYVTLKDGDGKRLERLHRSVTEREWPSFISHFHRVQKVKRLRSPRSLATTIKTICCIRQPSQLMWLHLVRSRRRITIQLE